MPNTYHRFHASVSGTIRHADVVVSGTYGALWGYPDWPNWVPQGGNVAGPGTDFSQFQLFQRGVIIIEVKYARLIERWGIDWLRGVDSGRAQHYRLGLAAQGH